MRTILSATVPFAVALASLSAGAVNVHAQAAPQAPAMAASSAVAAPGVTGEIPPKMTTPPGYTIGVDDVLSIVFWREKDLSASDVTVRPDGKVTLPLLNDVRAAGLTPDQLRDAVVDAARKYVEDPTATVIVKEIKSRKVFITGRVEKPGPYALNGPTTVLQLIAIAGGLRDFADGKNITVMRSRQGAQSVFEFNYQDVLKKKNLRQNIELEPGDTVVVP